jgi:transcriptional regulator with XRE-family HTH domain
MSKPYSMLRGRMKPAARRQATAKTKTLLAEMPLQELRQARNLTQEQLAESLSVKQAAVSKLEKRTDMYVSTLRNFIRAMGGDLEIIAKFPDGAVQINQFVDIGEKAELLSRTSHSTESIYPEDIERVLSDHPKVAEASVVGYPDDLKGQSIHAYITLKTGIAKSEDIKQELIAYVRSFFRPVAKLDKIQWADGLPKNRSGKIMRKILKQTASDSINKPVKIDPSLNLSE